MILSVSMVGRCAYEYLYVSFQSLHSDKCSLILHDRRFLSHRGPRFSSEHINQAIRSLGNFFCALSSLRPPIPYIYRNWLC